MSLPRTKRKNVNVESRYVQWTFVLSCVAMSAAFVVPSIVSLIGNVLAFAVAYYMTFRLQFLKHVFLGEPSSPATPLRFHCFDNLGLSVAFVFTLIAVGFNVPLFLSQFHDVLYRLQTQVGVPQSWQPALAHIAVYLLYLTTAPVFFVFFYAFIIRFTAFIAEIYRTSDKIERYSFVTVMLVAIVAVAVIYNQTNCFYAPLGQDREIISFDVVYVADSGNFYKANVYGFIGALENDLRQPLFGLLALPFAITATLLSWTFFFIPNSYAVFIQTIQIGLLFLTYILMSRLMRLSGLTKILFFIALFLTYPVLLFFLVWEQYIFAVFWLGVFIYIVCTGGQAYTLAFVSMTGSLLTSAAVFLFTLTKDWRLFVRNGIVCSLYFFVFVILCGKLAAYTNFLHLLKFTGIKYTLYDKLSQFSNYVVSVFIKPMTIIGEPPSLTATYFKVKNFVSYQLAPVESLNLFGLFLLAFCVLGFILNYKDKFAQICAFWIAFSFFVLCLVGWGTAENGLILYSLYFGWAYFCLAFLAVEKLLQKLPAVKYAVNTVLIAVLASINIPGIYDLIQFGIKYYPCQ